jgi:tetrahydromethanopterin S-methyltransferase subunit F
MYDGNFAFLVRRIRFPFEQVLAREERLSDGIGSTGLDGPTVDQRS